MMIYFAELFMTGEQHAAFNAAMLKVLAKVYPHDNINIFASPSHYQQLRGKDSSISKATWSSVKIVPNKSSNNVRWLLKYINELSQIFRILFLARFRKVELVYFAFLSPVGQYVVSFYSRYFGRKGQKVMITLHGLDILLPSASKKWIDKCYGRLLKRAFALAAGDKIYIVLEERVANYLLAQGYLKAKEIIEIPHPYQFNVDCDRKKETPIIFAHLGVARLAKKSQLFFELAASYSTMIKAGDIVFQVIGPVLPEMKPYLNEWVDYVDAEVMLSTGQYQQACMNAHYAVFFYDESNYALTSSGALLDAISFKMPIIALQGPVFNHFSATSFPGKLYPSFDALKQGIVEVMQNHVKEYTQLKQSFVALQKRHSIDHVAQLFKKQVSWSFSKQ